MHINSAWFSQSNQGVKELSIIYIVIEETRHHEETPSAQKAFARDHGCISPALAPPPKCLQGLP